MILPINFTSIFFQALEPKQEINHDNQPLANLGRFYKRLFSWLEQSIKNIYQDLEREFKASQIPDQVLAIHDSEAYLVPSQSKAGEMYITDSHSCSCPDFQFRGRECKHIKRLRSSIAYIPGKQALPDTDLLSDSALKILALEAKADLGF